LVELRTSLSYSETAVSSENGLTWSYNIGVDIVSSTSEVYVAGVENAAVPGSSVDDVRYVRRSTLCI
jgi:hypothetical protein